MLRAGVTFPALMKLLGHSSADMTMRYLKITVQDLQREFHLARSQPRYLAPQPKSPSSLVHANLPGIVEALQIAQHVMEMFRRAPARVSLPPSHRPPFQSAHQDHF